MAKNIIADSCYWFALFDQRDNYHDLARCIDDQIQAHTIIIPWPSLYETINTRFIRRQHHADLDFLLKSRPVELISDLPYREESLAVVFDHRTNSYSLVDHIIRSMLGDASLNVHGLITFNQDDFSDICYSKDIELICG